MEIITKTIEETTDFGKKFAHQLNAGDVVLLHGDLGAGKTTFTKGLALGFDIINEVVSPTFTLMNVYPVNSEKIKNLVHIDTYRLNDEQDLIDIGIEDYLGKNDTVCLIEWPEKINSLLLNKKIINIAIESISEQQRKITIY